MKAARGLVKLVALLVGGAATVLSLMSLAGAYFVDSAWLHLGLAVLAALVVPLVLAELALRGRAPDSQRGVASDILALCYLGFSLAFVGVAHAQSKPLLRDEGQVLQDAGLKKMSRVAYLLAGGGSAIEKPEEPKPVPPATPSAPSELRTGDGKERTPAQIFKDFAASVVTVSVKTPMGEGGGTGFILDQQGTIATNYHVVGDATSIEVKLMDGTMADAVEILVENQPGDLALLRIKAKSLPAPVVLGDSEKVTVGERAVSIGNPLGLEHTLTDGVVSSRRVIEGHKMIQMSTPVSPGNSGGPLFNARGEVIGITTAVYNGGTFLAQNLNLATPINDLKTMIKKDYPGRHKVGDHTPVGGTW